MNPFRPNAAEDFSEDDLLAFHLHELLSSRERVIRRAIETDPALAAESESVAASLDALKDVPMHVDRTILDRNWKTLRPSLLPHVRPAVRARRWRLPVFAGAAVAFAATLAFFVAPRSPELVPKRKAAPSLVWATPNPLPVPTQDAMAGSKGNLSLKPLSKSVRDTSPLHPRVDQPQLSIYPSTLAQVPATPLLVPPLTPVQPPPLTPEPVVTIADSSSTADQAQPLGQDEAQRQRSKKKNVAAISKVHRKHETDVMMAVGGTFIVPQGSITATHAIAAVGALHQQLRPALGYRITASYSRPDFAGINSRVYEIAGTYVFQGPRHKRLSTSVDAGGGLLAFLPTLPAFSTTNVYRAAGVLGVNVDYAITSQWGARLAYRAQIFKTPDFRFTGTGLPVATTVTVSNEPSLGITFRFGKK